MITSSTTEVPTIQHIYGFFVVVALICTLVLGCVASGKHNVVIVDQDHDHSSDYNATKQIVTDGIVSQVYYRLTQFGNQPCSLTAWPCGTRLKSAIKLW